MARILVAGEDMAAVQALAAELAGEGHIVAEAATGQEAYDLALAEPLDLVFLEVVMPVFNGYETCRLLREDPDISATLPIVFLVSDDYDARRLETIRATDTLPKVHEAYEVRELLARYLAPEAL
ncbi:MAG TPA: response regulator [Candidatus Hydrogenedentes bacterium]|nr:response regulator [Candidatus Hydrogenedentota bacterium]HPG65589.1 response regulator [Candidatus Hydrogenedentota bacterium]